MLNEQGIRELCYTVKVDDIQPIEGADRVETAVVGGWHIMVRKNQFKSGDIAVYFEIDSKVPEKEPFMFLESKHFRIKTQKYFKGSVISQGLLMSFDDFIDENGRVPFWVAELQVKIANGENVEHTFLTKELGVTYAVEEDNKRKAPSADKYKQMSQRRPNLFKQPWAKWMMRRSWGRKVMFFFFGKKKDKKNGFPTHFPYVKRSDEERVENIPFILEDKEPWIKTLKIDGTSSTYILERKKIKNEFYVCSRNVRQLTEDQSCFHEENVYWINEHQYHIRDFLEDQLKKHPTWSYVCLQGESAGEGIQGNPHKLKGIQFFGFNFIDSEKGRWNSEEAANLCKQYSIPWVPILDAHYILPDNMEEMKLTADGPCDLEGSSGLREGFVYRSLDGSRSFKNVSREYLLKHH